MWTKAQIQEILDTYIPDDGQEITHLSLEKDKPFVFKWHDIDEHTHPVECEETVLPGQKPTVRIIRSRN